MNQGTAGTNQTMGLLQTISGGKIHILPVIGTKEKEIRGNVNAFIIKHNCFWRMSKSHCESHIFPTTSV